MKSFFYLLLFLTPVVFSCKSDPAGEIAELEARIAKSNDMDPKLAKELIEKYKAQAASLGDETRSTLLFRAGQVANGMKDYPQAIALWEEVLTKYPKSKEAAGARFSQAFTYEYYLGDIEKAKTAYQDFITRYPDNELAGQAKISMDNLGKTPEEMLKSVLKK